ncbi:4-phosphopantetheinyl transferase [Micromonospora craniellae]|uniref:4-phosphopantetheinyl transferase n=2 Tax=Micromonospora craniellae TaxID=2294034 RepID=A0A372G167_9ACTN|nr:4'-phosphopantetheinyl transferase superfamily protein [Micromonospora craniellae]RFS46624.1 4-phosphopantetheinyl transferase [Micromonospora craniellae]
MATGPPVEGTCQVWWAEVGPPDDELLLDLLSASERHRHAGFTDPQSRATHLTARALTRLVLAGMLGTPATGLRFEAVCRQCGGPHGKPVLRTPAAPVRFSVAHSGRWCAVAFATRTEVGVDVERIALRGRTLPSRALSPAERAVLAGTGDRDRTTAFIRYWTRKEALLKSTGDGLTLDPATITVTAPDRPAAVLCWAGASAPVAWPHLVDLAAPTGYAAALASLDGALVVSSHDGTPLLDRIRSGVAGFASTHISNKLLT